MEKPSEIEIRADLEKLIRQEDLLVFSDFDENIAKEISEKIVKLASSRGQAVTVEARIGEAMVYLEAMRGTAPANSDWARRKQNLVRLTGMSSYRMSLLGMLGWDVVTTMGLNPRDYVAAGGSFPVRVNGVGLIGAITVSGLPQREDHQLVVEVLSAYLKAELGESAL
jgi:uncharacterized protein (UPF0303 family)